MKSVCLKDIKNSKNKLNFRRLAQQLQQSIKTNLLAQFLFIAGVMFLVTSVSLACVWAATITEDEVLDITAVVVDPTATPGAGGPSNPQTQGTVTLSGFTFPNAKLKLLKDGAVTTTLIANQDGTFQIVINSLPFGNYQFSVFAEDSLGVTSAPYTINVSVYSTQPYTFSNIIIPPTISSNTLLVEVGKQFYVRGYAPSGSIVSLEIPGYSVVGSTTADVTGYYQISATANLSANTYNFRTKASYNNISSPYSKPIQITFYNQPQPGEPGIPVPPSQLSSCVDYNHDQRINLIDFSILIFWFEKNDPPPSIDCNADRVVDIKDFSILMYFWTG